MSRYRWHEQCTEVLKDRRRRVEQPADRFGPPRPSTIEDLQVSTVSPIRHHSKIAAAVALIVALAAAGAACAPPPPSRPAPSTTVPTAAPTGVAGSVLGASRVTSHQITRWYNTKHRSSAATVPVATLAQMYIEEGALEGVRGDVAFVQAMIETGWLTFPDAGQVRAQYNNFAGMGAVDGGSVAGPLQFADARTGVRAQIQHLRAYGDSTVTCRNFATPLATPRCHLVVPKGKAPLWSDFGNGNWATDPGYAAKIDKLYADLLATR